MISARLRPSDCVNDERRVQLEKRARRVGVINIVRKLNTYYADVNQRLNGYMKLPKEYAEKIERSIEELELENEGKL